jgi:antitoxin (DNA-binding transcriptional repressor) of toxin-antitoxin stability system
MKTATIRDLRYNFPKVEAWLCGGEEIALTKRGHLLGRIIPDRGVVPKRNMPDFASRARSVCGNRKINTAELLEHNKGRY